MESFTLRVYGIYVDNQNGILVSDEFIHGMYVTKFPGGGLHFGEGTITCLQREMLEETGQEFEISDHFYTTDFFQPSVFDPEKQVISIYYLMKPISQILFHISEKPFDF